MCRAQRRQEAAARSVVRARADTAGGLPQCAQQPAKRREMRVRCTRRGMCVQVKRRVVSWTLGEEGSSRPPASRCRKVDTSCRTRCACALPGGSRVSGVQLKASVALTHHRGLPTPGAHSAVTAVCILRQWPGLAMHDQPRRTAGLPLGFAEPGGGSVSPPHHARRKRRCASRLQAREACPRHACCSAPPLDVTALCSTRLQRRCVSRPRHQS